MATTPTATATTTTTTTTITTTTTSQTKQRLPHADRVGGSQTRNQQTEWMDQNQDGVEGCGRACFTTCCFSPFFFCKTSDVWEGSRFHASWPPLSPRLDAVLEEGPRAQGPVLDGFRLGWRCVFLSAFAEHPTHTHPTKQQIIHSTGGGDDAAFPSPSLTIHITPSSYSLSSLSSSFSLASSSSPADRLALLGPEQTALN